MQITCNRLRHILSVTRPGVGAKALPITQNILFKEGNGVTNHLDFAIAAAVPELGGDEEFLIPHGILTKTLTHVPGNSLLELTREGRDLTIKGEGFTSTLHLESDVVDFPDFPDFQEIASGRVDGDLFTREVSRLLVYTATETDRPVLNGICFDLGEQVAMAATNGFRMAWETLPFELKPEHKGQSHRIVVPAATLQALAALWKRVDKRPQNHASVSQLVTNPQLEVAAMVVARRYLDVRVGNDWVGFGLGEATLSGQLVSREFPNYKQLIPSSSSHQVVFDAESAYRAVSQLQPIAIRATKTVVPMLKVSWQRDAITIALEQADASGEIEIRATTTGRASHIAFNLGYLLEYLKDKEGRILMETTNPASPAVFTHSTSPNVVLMPMHGNATRSALAAETEEAAAEEGEAAGEVREEAE